jgi:hypothetical protein
VVACSFLARRLGYRAPERIDCVCPFCSCVVSGNTGYRIESGKLFTKPSRIKRSGKELSDSYIKSKLTSIKYLNDEPNSLIENVLPTCLAPRTSRGFLSVESDHSRSFKLIVRSIRTLCVKITRHIDTVSIY